MTGDGDAGRAIRHRSAALHDGGFAHAATVPAGGLLFTAGISPLADDGSVVAPDDAVGQVRHTVGLLAALLHDHDATPADVAKLTVYVVATGREVLGRVWQAVEESFDGATPPAILVGTTVLPYPGQVVEIEAVAALG